jgi:hypothetical protein
MFDAGAPGGKRMFAFKPAGFDPVQTPEFDPGRKPLNLPPREQASLRARHALSDSQL